LTAKKIDLEQEIMELQVQTKQVAKEMDVTIKRLEIDYKHAENVFIDKKILYLRRKKEQFVVLCKFVLLKLKFGINGNVYFRRRSSKTKRTQVKNYGPVPAGKHRKSLERGSSIPTGKFSDFFR